MDNTKSFFTNKYNIIWMSVIAVIAVIIIIWI